MLVPPIATGTSPLISPSMRESLRRTFQIFADTVDCLVEHQTSGRFDKIWVDESLIFEKPIVVGHGFM